ncbi:C-type lectin domain family 2 member E-like [Arvicanthis niloticus]|uniref:C-type lectin domain family 2 member E-like n=1 Tax=Arvicanthis niloticus TaxID=61156 RepID=UPI00402B8953
MESCEPCFATCPSGWIGFGRKCFYFSEDIGNWTFSQFSCMALDAHLALFDSLEELNFLKRYKGPSDHWIGLHRESTEHPWMWTDNTEYNNLYVLRKISLILSSISLKCVHCICKRCKHHNIINISLLDVVPFIGHLSTHLLRNYRWEVGAPKPRMLVQNCGVLTRGGGECAYLSDRGIRSSRGYTHKKWICNKPNTLHCPVIVKPG